MKRFSVFFSTPHNTKRTPILDITASDYKQAVRCAATFLKRDWDCISYQCIDVIAGQGTMYRGDEEVYVYWKEVEEF